MNMLGKVPASRLRLIEGIVRIARAKVKAADRALAEALLRRYFHGVAEEDLVARGPLPPNNPVRKNAALVTPDPAKICRYIR